MPIEVTLPMVLDAHTDARMQDTHVAVPGTIVSWSAATQEATVQPMVRKPLPSADGVQTYETPPQIQNVPCYVQRGGGYLVSVPFSAGDPVWLMFSEQSYAEYLSTGNLSSPRDLRRHGTGYPFALPGPAPASLVLQSVASGALVIGRDGQSELLTISPGVFQCGAGATMHATHGETNDLNWDSVKAILAALIPFFQSVGMEVTLSATTTGLATALAVTCSTLEGDIEPTVAALVTVK